MLLSVAKTKATKPAKPAAKPAKPAKPVQTTPQMATKLQKAANANKLDEVRALLDRGVDPNVLAKDTSTLAWAVYKGHEPVVKLLLERGADPNLGKSYPAAGCAMHAAAHEARVELLALLLEHGGDPNAPGQYGVRPLQKALETMRIKRSELMPKKPPRERYVAVVRALLAAGARPELEDERGTSAWISAARTDDVEVFDLIVATDPARLQRDGKTLMNEVAFFGSKLVDVLVERGIPADVQALQRAIIRGNPRAIERLLAHGVDPTAEREGKSSLALAEEHGDEEVLAALGKQR